ncbi:sugar phosphate isomerase/epimerase family protein [Candidatus Poribacteria bacterium]
MRVGLQTGLRDIDQLVEQCRQLDVNEVVLPTRAFSDGAGEFLKALGKHDIQVSAFIPPNPSREAVLGDDKAELESLYKTLRTMGETNIKTVLLYPLDRFKNYLKEYHHENPPLEVMPGEERWGKIIEFFRRVADIAEEFDLKIANHVFAVDVMLEILETVGSPNLGVIYCTGMYMFGYDPHAGVDIYGIDRIFLCHARNLVRHGPGRQGHEEVPLPDGDIDFAGNIRALMEAGYDGLIVPEHLGEAGELADSVVYLRKLIDEAGKALGGPDND